MTISMEINRLPLVRQRANNLCKKYGLSVPVNLNTIINKKHIEISYEENQVGIDGLCQLQRSPPRIILNTEITYEPRRRFTIAHEIGHICIPWHTGVDLCSLDDPYVKIQGQRMVNTQELEANIFASELLMPTEWLKQTFELNTKDLLSLVEQISNAANTSIMACFYALENVLPAGELFFIKTDAGEFWKPFRSVDTTCFYVSVANAIQFYNRVCYWRNEFRLSRYNVIHYKIAPAPDYSTLNKIYLACNSNLEDLLFAITGGNPISAIPYIDRIVNTLNDKFYVVIKIGDVCFRHFRHSETAIRMHTDNYDDIDNLFSYIQDTFYSYGRLDFSPDSCMLWVKERWRGDTISNTQVNPNELLKVIVADLYEPENAHHMLQSINGTMASINSTHKTASSEQLYHLAKVRYETDPKYKEFAGHHCFELYLSGKIKSIIAKRKS